MDLVAAIKEAKIISKKKKNELVHIVLEDGEFLIKSYNELDETEDDLYSTWRSGIKIDSPEGKKEVDKTENKTEMSKVEKKAAKKAAKPAKKVAVKKVKIAKEDKPKKVKVEKVKLGASFFFDKDQWKIVDGFMKEKDLTFNAWVNSIVFAKIK